jgi:hypothetical protein
VNDDELKTPEAGKSDAAHAVARAGLSAIPFAGGAAVELFSAVVQPPLEKRRIAWMNSVGEKLKELENSGLDLEGLQENENFISTVMYASQLALKTHREEKLTMLRNVITNAALGQSPEEAIEHMFLGFIDSLSALQIQILRAFQAPEAPVNMSMGGLSHILELNVPALKNRRELYDQLWKDLYSRGLVNTDGLHMTMSGSGLSQKRTTGLGDMFLKFVAGPSE